MRSSVRTPAGPSPSSTIAIVNSSSRFSGITLSAEPLLSALQQLGFEVRWYQCVDRGVVPYVPPNGLQVPGTGIRFESLEMGINRLWTFPRRLRNIPEGLVFLTDPTLSFVSRFHPRTVVYVHDLLPLSPYADRVDARLMFHSVIPKLRRMTRLIVPTSIMRDELVGRGVDASRIRVVPHTHDLGIHPEHVDKSVTRVAQTRELRALFVATDRPFKNLDFVFRLAKAMEAPLNGCRFTFTILSRLRPATRQRLKEFALSNVRVIEQVPSVAALYDECDVLVYPSLYEGFGRPIIESLSFGLPIIANRIQPFIELLGETGMLLSLDQLQPWVSALRSLTDPTVLRQWATLSLERSALYSPERFREHVAEALGDLIAPGR